MKLELRNVVLPLSDFTLEVELELSGRVTAIFGPSGELCAAGRQTAAVVGGWGVPLGRNHWATPPVATA